MIDDDAPLGIVPLEGRGSLPFALVHGEALVAAASWGLASAGVELVDTGTPWPQVRASERLLVVHDPLCPLVPVDFVERAIEECRASRAVVAGVRPVTDTVKELRGDHVGATHAREDLMVVTSPVVLPAAVLAALEGIEPDLAGWVATLAARFPVRFLEAPPLGRRVVDEADLRVLEQLSLAGR